MLHRLDTAAFPRLERHPSKAWQALALAIRSLVRLCARVPPQRCPPYKTRAAQGSQCSAGESSADHHGLFALKLRGTHGGHRAPNGDIGFENKHLTVAVLAGCLFKGGPIGNRNVITRLVLSVGGEFAIPCRIAILLPECGLARFYRCHLLAISS